ncbi:2-hydroxyacyl-CoA dehydratase family protein [Marinilabilia salmonicolor]|uniref:2-hydroxyacyl-CoA dehydratase family protein n=1 Tax=Marinilabilia salmonicolor TaxID=989 RepID=UPI00029B1E20|nr:2-hydroxyacyl-CoA dehydratase family protein [Marinilabilia salmonicolor]
MKNFDKADIIADVAYNKSKTRFLFKDEQMRLNDAMKEKIVRFASEMITEKERPQTMTLFDEMMNGMHGQRVKDLYQYRREGHHIMALLCNSIPPELIYALDGFIPVSVCMGAGEVEPFADNYTRGMCSLTRSMIGFLHTGMCVFFNLADYVLGSDLCPSIRRATDLVGETSNDFEVHCLQMTKMPEGKVTFNFDDFHTWVMKITDGKGLNKEKLVGYSRLFCEIRDEYQAVLDFRKHPNPPINGKNSLWIQQLALVEEPRKLLSALKKLKGELLFRLQQGMGYDSEMTKKRVMLITPRVMPPFGQIYRLVEKTGALIVCEESDMGITNINYDFNTFLDLAGQDEDPVAQAVTYMMECVDHNSSSCLSGIDEERLMQKIKEYKIDAVINYSFRNCPVMEEKTNRIDYLLKEKGIASFRLVTDYMEIYEKEAYYINELNRFLYT